MFSFQGVYELLSGELKWWFLTGFLIGTAIFCIKRAWLGFFIFLIGTIFIGGFVIRPEVVLTMSERFADLLNMGK
ncbi:hypothetical protein ABEY96_28240 [Priestia aryabhattai]|uniref:hypothetical protein n=1 Tax=Priestia aryabhattai TaxID=412384 RepID=UPI003D2BD36E